MISKPKPTHTIVNNSDIRYTRTVVSKLARINYLLVKISHTRDNFLVVLTICMWKLLNILFPHPISSSTRTMFLKMSKPLGCNCALWHSDQQFVKMVFGYCTLKAHVTTKRWIVIVLHQYSKEYICKQLIKLKSIYTQIHLNLKIFILLMLSVSCVVIPVQLHIII